MGSIDYISEAHRYLANAKETLLKTAIEYGKYSDEKYVREAAGIAYLAALKAFDGYFLNKGILPSHLPKSIEGYWDAVRKNIPINGKLHAAFSIVYENLHIGAYYRGFTSVNVMKDGLMNVKKIIEIMERFVSKGNSPLRFNESRARYRRTQKKKSVEKKIKI